jgi:hypothetical protein
MVSSVEPDSTVALVEGLQRAGALHGTVDDSLMPESITKSRQFELTGEKNR